MLNKTKVDSENKNFEKNRKPKMASPGIAGTGSLLIWSGMQRQAYISWLVMFKVTHYHDYKLLFLLQAVDQTLNWEGNSDSRINVTRTYLPQVNNPRKILGLMSDILETIINLGLKYFIIKVNSLSDKLTVGLKILSRNREMVTNIVF